MMRARSRIVSGGNMRLIPLLSLGAALSSLAACAPPVSQVGPIYAYPPREFGRTCEELATARARVTRRLIFANLYQDQLYKDDQTRTLGIPTPLGSPFEENRAAELGWLKGELVQINKRIRETRCEAP
jgi:hypothetical protein